MRWSRSDGRILWIGLMTSARCLWLLRAFVEGGSRGVRPAAHLPSFASPKEGRPRKGDPAARVPTRPLGEWGTLRCSVLGCAAELAAFFELRSNSCGKLDNEARVLRHALTPGPALLGTVRRGWERAPPGPLLRSACGPSLRSARQGARASFVGSAQRVTDTRRRCAAAAGWYPLPTPAGCAEKRRAWGGCVCRRTHALRDLACRSCLNGVSPAGRTQ